MSMLDGIDPAVFAPPVPYVDWGEFLQARQGNAQLPGLETGSESDDLGVLVRNLRPTQPNEGVMRHLTGIALAHELAVQSAHQQPHEH